MPAGRPANPNLTLDELDVLFQSANGLTALEIADNKNMTKKAVDWRMEQLKRKLGAKTLPHAVSLAYQKGILLAPQTNGDSSERILQTS